MTRVKRVAGRLRSGVAWLLVLQLMAGVLAGPGARARGAEAGGAVEEAGGTTQDVAGSDAPRGLRFRLSEGAEESEARPAVTASPAPAAKLSEGETERVLARLPPLKTEGTDELDFNLRERSQPVPRTGRTVLASFPANETRPAPDAAASGPLQVLRQSPAGEVPLAAQLSVTFSQPMVAVTSQGEAAESVPARLSPQVEGRWRWLGTKTLLFEGAGERLPMATEFTTTVPAGTKSATGGVLAAPVVGKFATPPPRLTQKYPEGGPVRRDAIIFMEFDQRVDPAAVLRSVKAQAGTAPLRLRLATDDEIAADETVKHFAARAVKGRWLALRAVGDGRETLPGDSTVSVRVGPGTPSAEGPRLTTEAQSFSFRTYGPLRLQGSACGYDNRCTPFDQWRVMFTNPLDPRAFDKAQVRISPEVPDAKIEIYGNFISVQGAKRGRTRYTLTVDGALRDTFGQTLGSPATVTFNVGAAEPALFSTGDALVVLDPAGGGPRFSVFTVNHRTLKVTLYAVAPEDWWRYMTHLRYVNGYEDEEAKRQTVPPGRQVYSRTIEVKQQPDELTETRVDLTPALKQGHGQTIVVVESTLPLKKNERREKMISWVQATEIGLDAFTDAEALVAWTTSLKDGQPLAGVEVGVVPVGARASSGADGVARLPFDERGGEPRVLVARRGADLAILPESTDWWNRGTSWLKRVPYDILRWYVFDDRKMYRPGEEVSVKGWVRRVGTGTRGDVGALAGAADRVSYTVRDSRNNEITKGTAPVNVLGGFDLKVKLPATPNLGFAAIQLDAENNTGAPVGGTQHYHRFQVQEFRRPEFEVTAKASEGPHFVGAAARTTVAASYFAGGGLPNAEVNWNVTSAPGRFTPPNRGDFTFGKWTPWWGDVYSYGGGATTQTQTFTGRTDAAGRHHLKIDFESVNPPQASSVTAQASVTDVNRQRWTATTTMLVHPADLYVGLKSERTFVERGQPLVVQSIVSNLDGELIKNREVKMRAVLLDWVFERGQWRQQEQDVQECAIRSTDKAVECRFTPKKGGMYRVTARVYDDRERPNESELTLWVAGGTQPPARGVAQEKVELIPDKRDYRAGETAEILVQTPFYPAEGVLTLRRSGLVRTERFRMNEPSHTVRVPIEEAFTPNLHVQVDLVGAQARTDNNGARDEKLPKRPAFAKGSLNLVVPPLARKLEVTATPRDKALEPGGETTVGVEVRDAGGRPVAGSELAVVVVDESVLALTGYRLEDPLSVFYAQRSPEVNDYHTRRDVVLADPGAIAFEQRGGVGGGLVKEEQRAFRKLATASPAPPPLAGRRARAGEATDAISVESDDAPPPASEQEQEIRLRADFNALAVFAPSVKTDSGGRAEVKVKVPDNLTRYRVMAVSVAGGKQFGAGESAITARMPLMVRPSAPRFLNFGDRVELPVVLQNQTDAPLDVSVAVRAANAELTDGAGRRVTVPANDRVEVRFPVAASKAGTARFQLGAASGRHADAAEISLPVWTPATTEAFATYGEIDESAAVVQPVRAPADVVPQFGGLEITTSSTQLQALTDAVIYLVKYPYGCAEQVSSRVIGVAALKDVLTAFKAKELPSPEEMKAAVGRDIKRLQGMQNADGGFGFWRRGEESWPYISIHVANALVRAKQKGFDVPQEMLDRSRSYLRDIERHTPTRLYSPEARHALAAYALNVRQRMGDRDAAKARSLIVNAGGLEKLSLESIGWLLPVLSGDPASATQVEAIRRHLNNRVEETAGAAHFTSTYNDSNYLLLHSDRRADGVILEALIGDQPQSDLIPKLVRGLLAHRKQGRWTNTQENAFILLALDRYFNTYEKVTPDFVARAWLGEQFAGTQEFRGRSTDYKQVNVPMRVLTEKRGNQDLILSKEGAGRLYYRIGMQYAPASLKLAPADYGFTVERVYEAIDDPADVRRDADGTWRIKAGAKVRVRLTLGAQARRYHVALVDPLPAGLEALNPALAVTERIPADVNAPQPITGRRGGWWWWRQWFEHQNIRDERVEAFTSLLWEGVYTYSYVARATTPGAFVVPPPKAEEMYSPETFGRGATDRVLVE